MPFNEATKREAKERSASRCCICHKPFVEVHHIVPQSAGGSDFLENAAPLYAYCHDLYGGNPEKRRQIKQMRDSWWQVMERRRDQFATRDLADGVAVIAGDSDNSSLLTRDGIALYHCVYDHETFETAAHMIVTVVAHAQRVRPSFKRHLYLDIEGHRNEKGGYDHDMFELQSHFIIGFLMPFLTTAHIPFFALRHDRGQDDDVPDQLHILGEDQRLDVRTVKATYGQSQIYVADSGSWIDVK